MTNADGDVKVWWICGRLILAVGDGFVRVCSFGVFGYVMWDSWLVVLPDSIVVSISACHVEGPGSIPGRGAVFSQPTPTAT